MNEDDVRYGLQTEEYGVFDDEYLAIANRREPDEEAIEARILARKLEKQEREKRRAKKRAIIIVAFIAFVGTLAFSLSGYFEVDSIEVKGNNHYTAEEIINIAHASPGKNLIYNSGKGKIKEYLEQNPYIKSATIKRGFPSTLIIEVVERSAVCAIKYDNDFLVIDKEGYLLQKVNTKPKLTSIEGIVVKKIKQGEKIQVVNEDKFNRALELVSAMIDKDIYFVKIDMSEDRVKAYIYDTLTVTGQYKRVLNGIKKERLHIILERLFEDDIRRGTITFNEDGYASFAPYV